MDRTQTSTNIYSENNIEYSTFTVNTYFTKGDEIFDIAEKKTNDYHALIISEKALLSIVAMQRN